MPALFFKSTAEFETHQVSEADKAKTRDRRSTSFLNKNGWSIAQNFKVFSSRVARAIAGTEPPDRPQFKLDYHRAPESPVALLVGDPITKFLAACREDRLSPTVALESMQKGLYPSLHFLPQARYTLEHSQPVYLWRATEHVTDFWQTLALGAAPEILPTSRFPEEIEFLAAHEELLLLRPPLRSLRIRHHPARHPRFPRSHLPRLSRMGRRGFEQNRPLSQVRMLNMGKTPHGHRSLPDRQVESRLSRALGFDRRAGIARP